MSDSKETGVEDPASASPKSGQSGATAREPIGLGITHGPPTPAKNHARLESSSPPQEPRSSQTADGDDEHPHPSDLHAEPVVAESPRSPSPPRISIQSEREANDEQRQATPTSGEHAGVKVQASGTDEPPTPPPKVRRDSKPSPPTRGAPVRMESQASMQDVALTRNGTPASPNQSAGRRELCDSAQATPRTASASVTSLHSVGSVQSPSRPTSTRPGSSSRHHHSRGSSIATTLSLTQPGHSGNAPASQLSSVLITPPLQVLVNSKEAKKSPSFMAAAQKALDLCQAGGDGSNAAYLHPREIFEPLRLAISNPQTTSVPILITSLDLLSKLISHSFFSEPNGPPPGMSPLPDLIAHTITLSYSETSPPQVALQVVKALMAIVLSTDKGMLVHQSSLLKAIRTVYNVFLLSNDAANQVVAQGGLTQMVHHVFGRVARPDTKSRNDGRRSTLGENEARRVMGSREGTPAPPTPGPESNGQKMTL